MANAERCSVGSGVICANPRPASLSMTNHRCGLPSPVAQSGIHHGLLPRSGNRRRRRDRFDKLRFVRNGFAAQRRRICLASLIPRAPHQYLREAAQKQTGDEIRWVELAACYRPCAHSLDKSSVAQSWTEASRGDRISPEHVIIQRSEKCNTVLIRPPL